MVEATHAGCVARTRVSLPAALPVRAVRRIFCEHCEQLCEAAAVSEVRPGLGERLRSLIPSLPALSLPSASVPLGGAVPGRPALAHAPRRRDRRLRGPEPSEGRRRPGARADVDRRGREGGQGSRPREGRREGRKGATAPAKAAVPADAQLVSESTFSLALPPGWDRVNPAAGATFAAVSSDGTADATLWIQDDPKLDFATFEASSLQQLETLAGSARVVERNVGPSVQASSITLAPKNVPEGAPTYEVVLRGSGDNWYYLATTHQASAPADAIAGVDLIQGSFLPVGGKG